MNILVIEDNAFLAERITKIFKQLVVCNRVESISSYEEFLHKASSVKTYDIVLVDIILWENAEHKNGIDIIKHIRTYDTRIPIVTISGLSDILWLEKSFDAGANDYIIKPFRPKELQLRVMKWFRMYLASLHYLKNDILTYHEITYNLWKNEFYYKDQKIALTRQSKYTFLLLFIFAEKLVKNDHLIEKLRWDIELGAVRNIRIPLLRLKKALDEYGIWEWVHNIRGEWYMLKKK